MDRVGITALSVTNNYVAVCCDLMVTIAHLSKFHELGAAPSSRGPGAVVGAAAVGAAVGVAAGAQAASTILAIITIDKIVSSELLGFIFPPNGFILLCFDSCSICL